MATVEVYSLMLRQEWQDEQRRHGRIETVLNHRLRPTTHFIGFEVKAWTESSDLEHLVGWVADVLDQLRTNPGALPVGQSGMPEKVYDHGTARIDFHFWAADSAPDDTDRISVGGPPIGGFINSASRLRAALKYKTKKYDLRGKPFAVVVGLVDPMCDLDDVLNALVGDTAVVLATGEDTRTEDGVFGPQASNGRGQRRPELSAVFALQNWFPGGPYVPRLTRFDNPVAAVEFPADALPFGGHWGVTGKTERQVRADWLVRPVPPTFADTAA
ncbi:hypothetical protein [Actinoplanes sp. NPDC051851]|uniref:hypothetical protein n=1 Tax=Actinoplanes sp. NPDC051851 TaxID=3154753 RepID=UPI003439BE6B